VTAHTVLGVVQARMGSTRLPGKALTDLAGKPLVWHMIDRMRRVVGVDEIVLATTTDPRNEPLVAFCQAEGLGVFQHPDEDDLAGRIAGAIAGRQGDIILKTGGDCPLIDTSVLQKMVDTAVSLGDADFVSNRVEWSYPLGLSADVVSRKAVEWADANLTSAEDRELFAVYIRDNPDRFKVVAVKQDIDLTDQNWCVDTPEDLALVRSIFDALYVPGQTFGQKEVLRHLGDNRAEHVR